MTTENDMSIAGPSVGQTDSANWEKVDRAVKAFEEAWQAGQRPRIEDYLRAAEVERSTLLLELAHVDLERRLKAGETARAEEYLLKFPDLRSAPALAVDLITTEFRLRQRLKTGCTVAEFVQRFPEFAEVLSSRLKNADSPQDEVGSASQEATVIDLKQGVHNPVPSKARSVAAEEDEGPSLPGYEIHGELGRGAMGVVYKAHHLRLNRLVALKMIVSGEHAGPEERIRFLTEAEVIAGLHHPQIVQVYEIGQHKGLPFFAMEYVQGGNLERKLRVAPLPPLIAARLVELLAGALQFAHQHGVVHRDLKPGNILLASSTGPDAVTLGPAGSFEPKVTDFGLARRLEAGEGLTRTGDILGTPSYMAPEQASGAGKRVGPAGDVYSLGAILYECLSGRPPFVGPTPLDTVLQVLSAEPVSVRHLQPTVPRDLNTICLKCLEKNPERRYASAKDLADDLHRFLHHEPITARPANVVERTLKWCRRHPWPSLVIAIALLCALGLSALSVRLGYALHAESEQRKQAYENLETAVEVIHSTLIDTSEDLADVPNMQKARQELLRQALPALEKLISRYRTNPLLRSELALLRQRAGELYQMTGNLKQARFHLDEAVGLQRELAAEEKLPTRTAALAAVLRTRGNLLRLQEAAHQLAEDDLRAAIALYASLTKLKAEERTWIYEQVEAWADLSMMLKAQPQRGKEALACLEEGHALLKPLSAQADCTPHLARVASLLAGQLSDHGRKTEARAMYELAVQQRRLLYQANPKSLTRRRDLAETSNDTGLLIHQIAAPAAALEFYLEALEHRRELARLNPEIPQFAHLHALTANSLGLLHLIWLGKTTEAETYFKEALTVRRQLLKKSRLLPYRNSEGHILQNLALLKRDLGKPKEALKLLDEVVQMRDDLVPLGKQGIFYRKHRAYSRGVRGELLLELGERSRAETDLRASLKERQELLSKNPGRPDLVDDVVLGHLTLGRWHLAGGQARAAEIEFAAALPLVRPLRAQSPEYARHLADVLIELAPLANTEQSLTYLQEAVQLGRVITAQQPGFWEHQEMLGRALYWQGVRLGQKGQLKQAQAALDEAREVQEELHRLSPGQPVFTYQLALTLSALGQASLVDRPAETPPLLQRADQLFQLAQTAAPDVPRYRQRPGNLTPGSVP